MKVNKQTLQTITFDVGDKVWSILDHIHKTSGVNKTTQVKRIIETIVDNIDVVYSVINEDIMQKVNQLELQADELRALVKENDAKVEKSKAIIVDADATDDVVVVDDKQVEADLEKSSPVVIDAESISYAVYKGLKWDDGLAIPILASLVHRDKNLMSQCEKKYKNESYSLRGKSILDSFINDNKSVHELCCDYPTPQHYSQAESGFVGKLQTIASGKGWDFRNNLNHKMSYQNMVTQICKAFYKHGTREQKNRIFFGAE